MADNDVTLGTIMEHMRGMEQRVTSRIQEVHEDLSKRMDGLDAKLTGRLDRLERNLTAQIDAIDNRLDAMEVEHLPKRVARVEHHLGLTAISA